MRSKSPTRAGKRPCRRTWRSRLGANVIDGKVTYHAVAEAFGLAYTPVET
jgi:alanine dehydrogenase